MLFSFNKEKNDFEARIEHGEDNTITFELKNGDTLAIKLNKE